MVLSRYGSPLRCRLRQPTIRCPTSVPHTSNTSPAAVVAFHVSPPSASTSSGLSTKCVQHPSVIADIMLLSAAVRGPIISQGQFLLRTFDARPVVVVLSVALGVESSRHFSLSFAEPLSFSPTALPVVKETPLAFP